MKQRPSATTRRLLPLYIAAFLQSVPFWYATEKLFMTNLGFNTVGIGFMVAIMSIVMLAVETPSGVMADRWSRKGVMLLGGLSLLLSGIVGGLSYTEPMYILSTVLWGVYAALYSGTYDSVIYDVTLEEDGNSDRYQKNLGTFRICEGAAFVTGALGGGIIASALTIRHTYFISIPFILLAGFFLWKFREPTLHKAEVAEPVFTHIKQTFAAVLRNRLLLPVIISLVGFAVIQETVFELSQLWFIALATPVVLYGLISAAVFSTWTLGGLLAHAMREHALLIISLVAMFAALAVLIFGRNYWLAIVAQFALGMAVIIFGVILSKKMHDQLPSRLRAGASSVISTLSRIILIPGSLLFTALAQNASIFSATYLLLVIAIIASIAYLFTRSTARSSAALIPK